MKADCQVVVATVEALDPAATGPGVEAKREAMQQLHEAVKALGGATVVMRITPSEPLSVLDAWPLRLEPGRLPPTRDERTTEVDRRTAGTWLKFEQFLGFAEQDQRFAAIQARRLVAMYSSVLLSTAVSRIDPGGEDATSLRREMVLLDDCVRLVTDERYPGIVRQLGDGNAFKAWILHERDRRAGEHHVV